MTDARRKMLRIAAVAIVLISVATQTLLIANSWWDFDPRLTCDRLPYWQEWIECLHGESHLYIQMAELAVGSWLIAGVATLLGRFLPPYISAIVPGCVAVGFIWFMNRYWHEAVTPYAPFGQPTLSNVFAFTIVCGALATYLVGPVAGAWLLGLYARTGRRPFRVSTAT